MAEKQIRVIGSQTLLDRIDSLTIGESSTSEPPIQPPTPTPGTWEPNENGHIIISQPGTYTLDRDLRHPIWYWGGGEIRILLNGHSIESARDAGPALRAYVAWKHKIYGDNTKAADVLHVKGPGKIHSLGSHGIEADAGKVLISDEVHVICEAEDSGCVRASGLIHARKSLFESRIQKISNRHSLPAVIASEWSISDIEGCVIIGGQVGVSITAGRGRIVGNFISQNSVATNGYAVAVYRNHRTEIRDNVIVAANGRGILINGGLDEADADEGNRIINNHITAQELPNQEYGSALNACCIRIRYAARNNAINGNVCLALGGEGRVGCSALYLSNAPGVQNIFTDNVFSAVFAGRTESDGSEYLDRYAKAATFEGQGNWVDNLPRYNDDQFINNRFASNHICCSFSGRDGWQRGCHLKYRMSKNQYFLMDGGVIITQHREQAISRIRNELNLTDSCRDIAENRVRENVFHVGDVTRRERSYHFWTDARWRTPVNVDIQDSGVESDFIVRRSAHGDYPVNITIKP